MLGRNPGYFTSQSLILSDLFASAGYQVSSTSPRVNRLVRLLDTVFTLVQNRNQVDTAILDVYSGKAFVMADVTSATIRRCGHRLVMVLRGGNLPSQIARNPKWVGRVLSRADALVSPSDYLAEAVREIGLPARVIPNVVDLGIYPYRHRSVLRPRLFWMRSFHPAWNPSMAIRTIARVRQRFPEATLVMAGQDKGCEARVRAEAVATGSAACVHFPGFLDKQGKSTHGDAADIFLNTNRIDNMPVAVVEACAMGLPVVATDVGGISALLRDKETGLIVPDNNDSAMAEAVCTLLNDAELAGRLSRNGRALAERSSWPTVRLMWEELLSEIASSNGVPAWER
jgi:glycosyltransferase involved in cell wall biosynthesis